VEFFFKSLAWTPQTLQIGVALEEMGLGYDLCTNIPDFILENYNKLRIPAILDMKLPAILDMNGPQRTPVVVFDSGCILMHLARKTGKFLSVETLSHTIAWLQFLKHIEYYDEDVYLLETLERHLSSGCEFIVGDTFSIADMATFPWILSPRCASLLRYFPVCMNWAGRCSSQPASSRGMKIFN
jgi:GST-like protein